MREFPLILVSICVLSVMDDLGLAYPNLCKFELGKKCEYFPLYLSVVVVQKFDFFGALHPNLCKFELGTNLREFPLIFVSGCGA